MLGKMYLLALEITNIFEFCFHIHIKSPGLYNIHSCYNRSSKWNILSKRLVTSLQKDKSATFSYHFFRESKEIIKCLYISIIRSQHKKLTRKYMTHCRCLLSHTHYCSINFIILTTSTPLK